MSKLLTISILLTVAGALTLNSCSPEHEFDANPKVTEYANSWKMQFGNIDPNQNWSMSITVSATASCPTITGESEMRIYSDAPLEDGSNLMAVATLNNGEGNIAFDAPKNISHVFVSVKNSEGLFKVYNYFAVENGTINVTPGNNITLTRSGLTRATDCNVTKGDVREIGLQYESLTKDRIRWSWQTKTVEEWKQVYYGLTIQYYNPGPFTTESIITQNPDGTPNYTTFDFSHYELKSDAKWVGDTKKINLTLLNGVAREEAVPCWTLRQGYKLFGPGSFFMEQQRYYSDEKMHLYPNGKEGLEQVEKGFSIVTEGGEITMPVVYGATNNSNRLGYVYYKDGQDPLTQPHYILINDARPQSNIFFNGWKDKGTAVGDMQLSNWTNNPEEPLWGHGADTKLYGTAFKLAFFGENHDQAATYNFPAGYHIVFFIAPYSPYTYNYYNDQNGDYNPGNYNYSLPELNKRINHMDWNSECPTYDPNRGAIKAASWTFNGQTFLGFEDGGNDEDLNDIVFWVQGQYKAPQPPITITDPDPLPEPEPESWIIACEDLGNTLDIDFNDVVFSVSHAAGQNQATVTPLAAGGTLASNIYHNGNNLGEIHYLINGSQPGSNGLYQMLNTTTKGKAGAPFEIAVPADYSVNNHGFTIKVQDKAESIVLESSMIGEAPQMLVLPGKWLWPTERTSIKDAYAGFVNWSQSASQNVNWHENPTEGKVVK